MRKRYRKPRIKNVKGYWIAQYRDLDGEKRYKSLGPVRSVKKFEAEQKLAEILEPINVAADGPSADLPFGEFARNVYLPFYKRKWKASTASTNEDRIRPHLIERFDSRELGSFTDSELQDLLDEKSGTHSYSIVAHLRWDLRQMFGLAVAKGYLPRNPAELLFVPTEARRPEHVTMDFGQVRLFFSVLELREKVIGGLATLAGMRPGEIFGLKRSVVTGERANVQQRIYRGRVGTPKSHNSKRWAALGDASANWIAEWLEFLPGAPDGWLFPSERLTTPVSKDNCWRRHFLPRLKTVGLEWANFQVMRRTHSTLSDELGVDPQVRADQMGHTVDVNQNRYTKASHARRRQAVNALEQALGLSVANGIKTE
jgi:integrase